MQAGMVVNPMLVLMALLALLAALALYAIIRLIIVVLVKTDTQSAVRQNRRWSRDKRRQDRRQGRKFFFRQDRRQRWRQYRQGKRQYRQQRLSLRSKLIFFAIVLVLFVIFVLSLPLYQVLLNEHQKILDFVRLQAPVNLIEEELYQQNILLGRIFLIVTIVVLVFGIIGALTLSSLITQPIRKLIRHLEVFCDTREKQNFIGVEIEVNGNDEFAELGNTINGMTQGLAFAAAAESELSIGREIQKKFLPLELDKDGNKLSFGYKDAPHAVFFGYYAGAEGISGDYFDYHELDDRYYAIIKCDVAGKGIPAALIMVQVATMFLNYFKQWKPSAEGMHIEQAVYQINGFIETLGFQGRFAAFTLCIFDSHKGDLHFCNAGDNIIHIFDSTERRVKNITLPQTPAAGVLPNSLVESRGGYQVQTLHLKRGDMLLLYTDGIEESKRKFRDSNFNEIACNAASGDQKTHGNNEVGQWSEDFGSDRIHEILDTVIKRGSYTLHKRHSGEDEEVMHFDFSGCNDNAQDMIMALVAVERMFRSFYDPQAFRGEWVLIEKKIDTFLKNHFIEYDKYCAESCEYPGNSAYVYYIRLREDEQYDDLTILGVKRK